jgi:hypothetical protein
VREERGRWSERRAGRQVREREAAAVGEEEGGGGDR